MLFYLDEKNTAVLHPDAIKLCPELTVLDEKETLAIILAYDYKSPYRQFVDTDRRRKALIHAYGNDDKNIFDKDKIKQAVEAYISLQYNPKVELARTYQSKVDQLQDEMVLASDEKEIARIIKSINAIRESIRDLETEVYDEVAKEGKVVGGGNLSFLEKFQRNRDRYMSLLRKKKK
jgi:hypothetical protein